VTRPEEDLMSDAIVVRYRTKPEAADENQRLIEAVFAELAAVRPAGLQYTSFRLADGVSFVHVAHGEGRQELGELPAFQEFQREIDARTEVGPDASPATLVGSFQS
jgi:hypothetical protein